MVLSGRSAVFFTGLFSSAIVFFFWAGWYVLLGSVPITEVTVGDTIYRVTRWWDFMAVLVSVPILLFAIPYLAEKTRTPINPSFYGVVWLVVFIIGFFTSQGSVVDLLILSAVLLVVLVGSVAALEEWAHGVLCFSGVCSGISLAQGFFVLALGAVAVLILLLVTRLVR